MSRRSLRPVIFAICAALAGCGVSSSGSSGDASASARGPIRHFVNAPANAQAPNLARHYVDFSFDYPGDWTADPANGARTAANFAKFTRYDSSGVMVESFAVGTFTGAGDAAADQQRLPGLLSSFEAQVNTMPNYRRLSVGEPTTIDGLRGEQLTFTGAPTINGRQVAMFGRVVILPGPAGQPNGVTLIMLGTDASGEIRAIADLGAKGQLPVIVNSFKFGAPVAPAQGGGR